MKLITWNIQRGRGPDSGCSLERVVADLHRVADFDVLCLQEVSAVRVSTTHLEYFSPLQRELHRDACLHAAAARPGQPSDGPFCAIARAAHALLAGDFTRAACATVGVHGAGDAPLTYDFIFASSELASRIRSVRVIADVAGSGHQPLLIELS